MWTVAEVEFKRVGDECPTKEAARLAAREFRRKTRFYEPEEPPTYVVLIGPNGELEPLKPQSAAT